MGISRDKGHKRRSTGARHNPIHNKRKFELGRPPANTKISNDKKTTLVRTRGGNVKFRALRLSEGNFCWPSEASFQKVKIIRVVYNATSNELVRTNTLVKGAIVEIDGTPYKTWYHKYYGVTLGKAKKEGEQTAATTATTEPVHDGGEAAKPATSTTLSKSEPKSTKPHTTDSKAAGPVKQSRSVIQKIKRRNKIRSLEKALEEQFSTGRLLARIASRPGQSGRADGYVLEGEELAFYQRKIATKKKK